MTSDDYLAILMRRWPLIGVLAVLGSAGGYGVAHYLPKRFTSQTLVLVQQPSVPIDYVHPVVSDATNQRLATMQQEILSRSRLEPLIQQFGLYSEEVNRVPMEDLVARLRETITVTPVQAMAETRSQGLPGFNVSVTFGDARLAQQICSSITSLFIEENLKLRERQTEQTTQFIAKQLEDAKGKLDEQDAKLAVFQRRYIGSLPEDEQSNLNVLGGLSSQLDAATQTLARAQQDKTFAESSLEQQLTAWQATQEGHNPQTDEQQLSALQAQLTALKSKYTDDHPDVVKVMNDIETLKGEIASAEKGRKDAEPEKSTKPATEPPQIQSLRAQIYQYNQIIKDRTAQQEEIQQRIKVYQGRIEGSPAVEQQYKQMTRDYQTALDFYNDLLKKRDQSAMATDLERRQQGEQFTILDSANLPNSPSFPKKADFILGGLGGGLALGLALTLLLEMQDTSFRNEKDVEALLRLPVLAMVPAIRPLLDKNVNARVVMKA